MPLTEGQQWFAGAGFGMFIHWGPYAAGRLEPSWPLVGGVRAFPYCQDVTVAEYDAMCETFAPDDPKAAAAWADLAVRAGMTYAVLTTKHHDGWSLFPQGRSGFGIAATRPDRDLVGEYVDAFRAAGLRIGLYYSLPDWHHPDYPAWSDDDRPYGFSFRRAEPEAWARFRADLAAELDHLLSAYGRIDELWFDGGWERTAEEWGSAELEALIRDRQPDILINDRLPGVGDLTTPEQAVPRPAPDGPWETCMTIGESWGDLEADVDKKSAMTILLTLLDVVAAGGNFLLNVSPDADGAIPAWQVDRIETVGRWMRQHGRAVVGAASSALAPWQFDGPTTAAGSSTFLHCTMQPGELVLLRGVRGARIESVRVLGTGDEVPFGLQLSAIHRITADADPVCDVYLHVPAGVADPLVTTLEVVASGPLV